jgi:hypothetical protein
MQLGTRTAFGAVVTLAATIAHGAPAANKLDAETMKTFGGTYAAHCRSASGVRLRVEADTLAVEQGKKQVASHDVQRAVTYGGGGQPAGYQGTLLGDVPGGGPLVFQAHRDATGVYLLVDADAKLEADFGKAALRARFRKCDQPK